MKVGGQTVFPHQKGFVHHWFWKRQDFGINNRLHVLKSVELVEGSMFLHSVGVRMVVEMGVRVRVRMRVRKMMNRRQNMFLMFEKISSVTNRD